MKRSVAYTSIASLLLLFACVVHTSPSEPQPNVEVHDHSKPPVASEPPATPPATGPATPAPSYPPPATGKADGAECWSGADCTSGACEGMGCNVPGKCVSKARMCTQDIRSYCGCDGKSFQASGSCPGLRFASRGECPAATPPAPAKLADGAACATADQCASGTCEGQGCDASSPGKCVAKQRMCTKDLRSYCGCDGKTFQGSGSCPGKRFASAGECAAATPTPAPPPARLADGAACAAADQCASGVCEGKGCDAKSLGKCVSAKRMCTRDYAAFCSCTGETFHGSGSCPGQRYASKGACPAVK